MQHDYSERYQRIWRMVAKIPAGKVATYGQIAELAGIARGARQVGYALHQTPDELDLPWHRVINARGEISFPRDSEVHQRQRQRLADEDVIFHGGRVDLKIYRWQAQAEDADSDAALNTELDELLWKPNDDFE